MSKEANIIRGRKSKRKGGRVERALVALLKEEGCASARRTCQFAGKSLDGPCDVVAPAELPSFHIESKGTKSLDVGRGMLREWVAQVKRDCPPECKKIPVIFHKANNAGWVALISEEVKSLLNFFGRSFVVGTTVTTPSLCYAVTDEDSHLFESQLIYLPEKLYALPAQAVIKRMLKFESHL